MALLRRAARLAAAKECIMRRTRKPKRQAEPMGRLVLVIGGEQPTIDVLVSAARRRFASYSSAEFPPRLVTRKRPIGDTELSTTRRAFLEIEGEGGFLLQWDTAGVLHGYLSSVCEALSAGRAVVLAAPAFVVSEALKRWPHTRVVRVTIGAEAARLPLRPRACVARTTGGQLRRCLRPVSGKEVVDAHVHHSGDLSAAVRSLTEALVRLLKEPVRARSSTVTTGSRKRAGVPRVASGALPPVV
jgi:ribose 1,5-bisphosphokinase PhnN